MIHKQSVFDPWPIESESVQAVITSPPYYALRKYAIPDVIIGGDKDCKHEFEIVERKPAGGSGKNSLIGGKQDDFSTLRDGSYFSNICIHCNAWKGQYGLEPTPAAFVEHTRLWAKEAWRVLRNDGIMMLNLSDSYPSGGDKAVEQSAKRQSAIDTGAYPDYSPSAKLRQSIPKCQLLIPHRVAIALVDDGWTLRNTIIWYKTNGMPESVTDRFSKKYEYIFMFTKQEKYYFDLDAVLEPYAESSVKRYSLARGRNLESVSIAKGFDSGCSDTNENYPQIYKTGQGSVKARGNNKDSLVVGGNNNGKNPGDIWIIPTSPSSEKHFAMWPERLVERMVKCSTKAGDIVLDCFAGSATTLKVAEQLNRKGIGIDLGYHEISKRRTSKIQKELFI